MNIIIRIFFLFFLLYCPTTLAHDGEYHAEEKIKQKSNNVSNQSVIFEKTINNKIGSFKFILEQKAKEIYQDNNSTFKLSSSEIVENSFLEPENIKFKSLNIKVANTSIPFKIEGNNIYSFNYTFSKDENIIVQAIDENNNQLKTEFKIHIILLPINYLPYTIIFIIFVSLIISIFIFIRKSNSINQKVIFSTICLIIAFISISIVKILLPLRILPIFQEKISIVKDSSLEVSIPKETQLLFDITTKKPEFKDISNSINVFGTIKTYNQDKIDVISPFSGKVFIKDISVGQKVLKNQNLGYIEQTLTLPEQLSLRTNSLDLKLKALELESKIKVSYSKIITSRKEYDRTKIDYQAKKDQLEKQIQQSKLNLDLAKKEFMRSKDLFDSGSASTKRLQEAQNNVDILMTEINNLEKQKIYNLGSESPKKLRDLELQIKSDNQDLVSAKNQIKEISNFQSINNQKIFDIISPIDGVIAQINTSSGSQEDPNKLLLKIDGVSRMTLEAEVFEKDTQSILNSKIGQFSLTSYPNEIFKIDGKNNKFISISNTVDPDKRTITVIFKLNNQDNKFKDGMFANISLESSNKSKNIVIPKSSILEDIGRKFVYIYKSPEVFEKREIKVGQILQDQVSVISGLKESEKIAVNGLYQLNSAMIEKK